MSTPATGFYIKGPAAAVYGWIPYSYSINNMSANEYTIHPLRNAFDVMFDSGNTPDPPNAPGTFLAFTHSLDAPTKKNFRAACWLNNVRAMFDANGSPIRPPIYTADHRIGYTPVRLRNRLIQSKLTLWHDPGLKGFRIESYQMLPSSIHICYRVGFRLSDFINIGAWWYSRGLWAPYAFVQIDYIIDNTCDIRIEFRGSYIPSQRHYVNWQSHSFHDMLWNDRPEIDAFMGAGGNVLAPGTLHYTWTGAGQRCC